MKKYIIAIPAVVLLLIVLFVACDKDSNQSPEANLPTKSMAMADFATTITIRCPGCNTQKCRIESVGDMSDPMTTITECSYGCGNCSMTVTQSKFYYATQEVETITFEQDKNEIHFYRAFNEYVLEKHQGEEVEIIEIEETTDPLHDTYTILYTYEIAQRKFSVRFSLVGDKATRIDCTGSCDCRERYFPSTGASECTCSPCQMDVTDISKSLY